MVTPTYSLTFTDQERQQLAAALQLFVGKLMNATPQIEAPQITDQQLTSWIAKEIGTSPQASPAPALAARIRWARDRRGIELSSPPKDAVEVTAKIWKQERKDLADGRTRLKVVWPNTTTGKGYVDAACWDEKLFPWIAAASKAPTAVLYVVKSGKYLNIVGVQG